MISTIVKALVALVLVTSGVAAGAAATGSLGHLTTNTVTDANLTAAEQAAISYVDAHYPGNGTAKILKVENSTENYTGVQNENETENGTTATNTGESGNVSESDLNVSSENVTGDASNTSSESDANVTDFTVLAPNGHVYSVEVNTTTDKVISAELSDYQYQSGSTGSEDGAGGSSDGSNGSSDSGSSGSSTTDN